jgi:hypothetical protein
MEENKMVKTSKLLTELRYRPYTDDVEELASLVDLLPIALPDDQTYVCVEKDGRLDIYGARYAIDIDEIAMKENMSNLRIASKDAQSGLELTLGRANNTNIRQVIIHTDEIYHTQAKKANQSGLYSAPNYPSDQGWTPEPPSESKKGGESKPDHSGSTGGSGESRNRGESSW